MRPQGDNPVQRPGEVRDAGHCGVGELTECARLLLAVAARPK